MTAGRDVYQGAKRNFSTILILVIVGSALYGSYKVGVWWGRNYRSWFGGLLARLTSLVVLGSCWLGTLAVGHLLLPGLLVPYTLPETLDARIAHFTTFDTAGGTVTLSLLCLTGLGVLRGLVSRRGHRLKWEADAHNTAFFQDHGLQEIQEDRLRDSQENGYRLENVLPGELEFMALGHPGMCAYLTFDETGKYTAWSSMVPQR